MHNFANRAPELKTYTKTIPRTVDAKVWLKDQIGNWFSQAIKVDGIFNLSSHLV